jgi:hypothetical protein
MKNIVVLCLNVHGLAINDEKIKLQKDIFISKGHRHIIVLTETKVNQQQWIAGTARDSKYYAKGYSATVSSNRPRGVIVLVKKNSGLTVKFSQIISPDIIR